MVDTKLLLDSILLWFEPNNWHLGVQFLWPALVQHVSRMVPPAPFKEEASDVATIRGPNSRSLFAQRVHDPEGEAHCIDREHHLSREVLQGTSQESLWEEESRNPIN